MDAIVSNPVNLLTPFASGKWNFFGDESGSRSPGNEQRFACYAVVAIPEERYESLEKELPPPDGKKGYRLKSFDKVFSTLVSNGGQALCIYFDMKHPLVLEDFAPKWERRRKESGLPSPTRVETLLWLYQVGFGFLELLADISGDSLPVSTCSFKYDDRTLPSGAVDILKKHGAERTVNEVQRIIKEIELIYKSGIFAKANPVLGNFGPGRSKEVGIRIADVCVHFAYARLKAKTKKSFHELNILDKTDILIELSKKKVTPER